MKEKIISRAHIVYIISVATIIFAATALCSMLSEMGVKNESLIMVYIIGVLLSTVVTKGYVYGFVAAVLGLLCYNYFFTYPHYTMRINDIQDVIMISFFFVTAIIGGLMSSRYKNQSRIAEEKERTTRLMYEITECFVDLTGVENIVNTAIQFIRELTGYDCEVNISGKIYRGENAAITDGLPSYTIPIKGKAEEIGKMTVFTAEKFITPDKEQIIKAIVYQAALVLDREAIYTEREKIKLDIETERLKSTLLRSISHDIRTPLTGILGASTTIVDNASVLSKNDMTTLARDIMDETEWLILTVQNILNMTRLSENALTLQKDIELVDDLILQAITRISRVYSKESSVLSSEIPEELIFVNVDGPLFVSVLTNLLDNAFKHSKDYTKIILRAYAKDDDVVFEVIDDGCGIDESMLGNIFDGLMTVKSTISDKARGMGLGLGICKAIVSAHGGTIEAENREKGAIFRVILKKEGEI